MNLPAALFDAYFGIDRIDETVDKVLPKKPVKGSELTNQEISDAVIRDLQTRAGCDR